MNHYLKHFSAVITVAAATVLASACSSTPYQPGGVPAGAQRMTSSETNSLLQRARRDQQIFEDGVSGGLRYNFGDAGRLAVTSRFVTNKTVHGQWRVAGDGQLCIRLENDPEKCHDIYRLSSTSFYIDVPRYSQQANTLNLRPAP